MKQLLTCVIFLMICAFTTAQSTIPFSSSNTGNLLKSIDKSMFSKVRGLAKKILTDTSFNKINQNNIGRNYYEVNKNVHIAYSAYVKKYKEKIFDDYMKSKKNLRDKMLDSNFMSSKDSFEINNFKIDSINEVDKRDVLDLIKVRKYLLLKRKNSRTFNFLSGANEIGMQKIYNDTITDGTTSLLQNSIATINPVSGKVSVYNELISDYFSAIRFSFGTTINGESTVSKTDTSNKVTIDTSNAVQNALQRLAGGGGNLVVQASTPFLIVNAQDAAFKMVTVLSAKWSFDAPNTGISKSSFANNLNVGLEGFVTYASFAKIFQVFSTYRLGYIIGSEKFYDNLNLKNDQRKGFMFNSVSVGLSISDFLKIEYRFFGGNKFVRDNYTGAISVSIVPKKSKS